MSLIIFHLIVAFGGMAISTVAALMPSRKKIHLSYGLIALTLLSGSALVIVSRSALLPSCLTGLLYLALTGSGLLVARVKLTNNQS